MSVGPGSDPLAVFAAWYAEHASTGPEHPDAMALATVGADGRPSVRTVLLKAVVDGRFRFFTNYESQKGRELSTHPHAALLFFWPELGRQVRVEGRVERLPASDSDEYFATRPRDSQLSAWASPQSQPISREELVRLRDQVAARFALGAVPRPAHWGGYSLEPDRVELWIGDPTRLHYRHVFRRKSGSWQYQLLGP